MKGLTKEKFLSVFKALGVACLIICIVGVAIMGGWLFASIGAGYASLKPIESPVVQIYQTASLWQVGVKDEFRGSLNWGSYILSRTQMVEIKGGEKGVTIKPRHDELMIPEVWLEGDKIFCSGIDAIWNRFDPERVPYDRDSQCDKMWAVEDVTNKGTDLLNRSAPQSILAFRNRYYISVPPALENRVVVVRYAVFADAGDFAYSLDEMTRADPFNMLRVDESIVDGAFSGTGFIVYHGPRQTSQRAGKDRNGNPTWEHNFLYQYGMQTLILTNAHVVAPMVTNTGRAVIDPGTGAIVAASSIIGWQVYVKLNADGKPLPATVVAADLSRDIAWLAMDEPLNNPPIVSWGNVNDPLEFGETVCAVGHPLGIPYPIQSPGILGKLHDVGQGHDRRNVVLDGRGGSSGSPLFDSCNPGARVIGILFAGYVELLANEPWEREGIAQSVPSGWLPHLDRVNIEDLNIEVMDTHYHHAGTPFMLAITLEDAAASAAENGFDIPGLSDQYDYAK